MKKRIRKFSVLLLVMLVFSLTAAGSALAAKPVAIKTPINGATVSGLVEISGTGSGTDTAVSIDGGAWQATSGGKAWTFSWDTTAYADGSHTIVVQYTDGSSSASITVTVSNGGSSTYRSPVAGEVLINEFVSAPSVTETSEWVELYNTTSETLSLEGMFLSLIHI